MGKYLPGKARSLVFGLGALLPYGFLAAQPTTSSSKVSFAKDVAPIFRAHCISCHSGNAPSGKLDLSTSAGILRGGSGGKLGNLANGHSLLLSRIDGTVGAQMPMGMAPLSKDDLAKVRSWVLLGMPFDSDSSQKHWAYISPVPPKIPVLKSSWIQNPIDSFVLQGLLHHGLSPSPAAPKSALLRRVSLDLTGLLPTPSEVKAFETDRSPMAYDNVVGRLLKSPHYGEQQAREWLDLARYADSDGYEKDLNRDVWLYRDWVINAFNRNEPYSQFTIDQIAGDLLPNSTNEEKIATGFQRNTMFNREGGVDQEEAHFLVELDRAEVTSTVWLGSTLNCARCHDHKYDPFTQKDYYRMVAFYNNTVVYPRGPKSVGEEKWFEAELKVPTKDQESQLRRLEGQVAALESQSKTANNISDEHLDAWRQAAAQPVAWVPEVPSRATSDRGQTLQVASDGTVLATGKIPDSDTYRLDFPPAAKSFNSLRLEVLPDGSLMSNGPGTASNGNFVLTRIAVKANELLVPATYAKADYTQSEYDPIKSLVGDPNGWAINGGEGQRHEMVIDLDKEVSAGSKWTLTLTSDSPFAQHLIGKFKVSTGEAVDATTELLPQNIRASLNDPAKSSLVKDYLSTHNPDTASLRMTLLDTQANLARTTAAEPTALVMQEKPSSKPLTEWVRHRGEFGGKTDLVQAGTPIILSPLAPGKHDRLALARWLVSKDNPLTARVQVNRMWEMLFGRGLVETSEDFGTRGSRPSHPELLDYLACWFMNHSWDLKALYRLIVTSSTYCQNSQATSTEMAKDPQNLWLGRGARFRMEAEMIHDIALDASGLLSPTIGGPSVYPYQPPKIWDSPYNGQQWMQSKGADLYRRGIYTFWKRTAPYPSFIALDGTSRESCTVRRIRTNTPLQALALLNDHFMLDAAAHLGKRMEATGTDLGTELSSGFQLCTSRKPSAAELKRLVQLEQSLQSRYEAHPNDAQKIGGKPKDAAFTMVGNVLLNLDETITKG